MGNGRRIVIFTVISLSLFGYIKSTMDFNFPYNQFDDMGNGDAIESFRDDDSVDESDDISDESYIHNDKRAPRFSLNGGLQSLTDMLYSKQRADAAAYRSGIRNSLLKLGKRQWNIPHIGSLPDDSSSTSSNPDSNLYSDVPVSKRRSQLSVSGPLSALANMLAAEGRRRQFTESRHNRMRLLELGKRSMEAEN